MRSPRTMRIVHLQFATRRLRHLFTDDARSSLSAPIQCIEPAHQLLCSSLFQHECPALGRRPCSCCCTDPHLSVSVINQPQLNVHPQLVCAVSATPPPAISASPVCRPCAQTRALHLSRGVGPEAFRPARTRGPTHNTHEVIAFAWRTSWLSPPAPPPHVA